MYSIKEGSSERAVAKLAILCVHSTVMFYNSLSYSFILQVLKLQSTGGAVSDISASVCVGERENGCRPFHSK